MTTTFVDFKHGGKEFVVQTVFAKGKDDAGIIFTSGSQSWATAVRPANKSRATALTDEEFLETVVASLVSQDRAVYDFDITETGDEKSLHLTIKVRVDGGNLPVNLCKLELVAVEDHARVVRSMLSTLIIKVKTSQDERDAQVKEYKTLQTQLAAAHAAVKQGVDSMKQAEGVLLGQFVAVLNAKKDEIARLHRKVDDLKEQLKDETNRPAGEHEPTASHKKRRAPSPSRILQDSDSEQASVDSEDEDRRSPPPASRPATETLPLASLGVHYEPVVRPALRGRGFPARAEPVVPPTPTPTPGPSLPSHARTPDLIDAALRDDDDEYGAIAVRPRALRRTVLATATASKASTGTRGSPDLPSQVTVASNVSAGTTASRRRALTRNGTNNSYE